MTRLIASTPRGSGACGASVCDHVTIVSEQRTKVSHSSRNPYRARAVRSFALTSALTLATLSFERTARAAEPPDAQAACISAYESLQESRARGELIRAREQAFECASSACPSFMQTDCSGWLEEIEAEVPSVSFEVRSGGKALGTVRVLEGDRVVAERVDGAAIELDPGAHSLRFEADGRESVTKQIVVERGAKNQRFSVELPAPEPARKTPETEASVETRSSSSPAPWIAGGIGLAGMAAFGILGASGLSQEASLERSCAPNCNAADLRSVETKYLLADISLGVGITALLVSSYLLLAPEKQKAAARAPSLHVRASADGGMASVRSSF